MRIYAFQVISTEQTQKLDSVFEVVSNLSLKKRTKSIGSATMRLEYAEKNTGGIWFADFVKWLKKGPGKAHREKRFEGIKLENDYKFASETGILYDSSQNIVLIEYNHIGNRHTSISDYLSSWSGRPTGYIFNPIIDTNVDDKWSKADKIKKLEFSVSNIGISEAERYADSGISETIALQSRFIGDKITVSIQTSRSNDTGIDKEESSKMINGLRKLITFGKKAKDASVRKLEVTSHNEASGVSDVIDFIMPKLCIEYEIGIGEDQRYTREQRWKSLAQAYTDWHKDGAFSQE